jgi:UDP-N-acetylmuramate dehydrogenase
MNWKIIEKELRGKTKSYENLKPYTSFKIGGKARLFVDEFTPESLIEDVNFLNKNGIPYKILGNATNLLISDSLIDSVILRILTKNIVHNSNIFIADSGVNIFSLITYAKKFSFGGLEFLAGIPGTLGGMAKLNAGAFGDEIGNFIQAIMLEDGEWHDEFVFSYRETNIEGTIIKIKLKLQRVDTEHIDSKIKEVTLIRRKTQPVLPSAGSIFKRPKPDFYVGKAIDDLGLKGYTIGGAMISKVHAGFIVNTGNATFADVMKLIDFIRNEILKNYNVDLDLEINIWR